MLNVSLRNIAKINDSSEPTEDGAGIVVFLNSAERQASILRTAWFQGPFPALGHSQPAQAQSFGAHRNHCPP